MLRDVTSIGFLAIYLLLAVHFASNKAHAMHSSEFDWLMNAEKSIEPENRDSTTELIENALKPSEEKKREVSNAIKASKAYKSQIQSAQKIVDEVNKKQKEFLLEDFGLAATSKDKIATKDGVNIGSLLSRYGAKDLPKEEMGNLPKLMVFISLGMPDNSLKQLADQVRKVGGVLVLRGMYKGSLQNTIKAIHEMNRQAVQAVIHPELFKKYKIEAVPVFVLENKEDITCKANKCSRIYDRLTGNVTLEYALTQFHESGSNRELARKYMERMRTK